MLSISIWLWRVNKFVCFTRWFWSYLFLITGIYWLIETLPISGRVKKHKPSDDCFFPFVKPFSTVKLYSYGLTNRLHLYKYVQLMSPPTYTGIQTTYTCRIKPLSDSPIIRKRIILFKHWFGYILLTRLKPWILNSKAPLLLPCKINTSICIHL